MKSKSIMLGLLSLLCISTDINAQYIGVLETYSLSTNGNDIVRDIAVTDEYTQVTVGSYQPTNTSSTYNGFIEYEHEDENQNWRVLVEGSGNDEINAVDINVVTDGIELNEEIYVTGYFTGTVYIKRYKWYPTSQVDIVWSMSLPHPADAGYFVAKLDHNGNVVWLQHTANSLEYYGEIGNDVDVCVVSGQVQVYTTGIYRGNPYFFQNGAPVFQLNASGNWTSAFTAKYVDNGGNVSLSWVQKINDDADNQHDYGYGVCGDGAGNVYTCGSIGGTTTLIAGSPMNVEGNDDAFVVKYSSTGGILWKKDFGAGGTIATPSDQARCITFRNNELHVSGYFNGYTAQFPGDNNSIDGFLIKMYPLTGVISWRVVLGGFGSDAAYKHTYTAAGDGIYVVGAMTGNIGVTSSSGPPGALINSPNGGTFANGFFVVVATTGGYYYDDEWVGCYNNSSVITTVASTYDDNVVFGGTFKDHYLYESSGVCEATNSNTSAFVGDGFTGIYLLNPFIAPAPASTENYDAEQSDEFALRAFPNPAGNTVAITKHSDAEAQFEVLDISGRVVIAATRVQGFQASVDLTTLEPGAYIIRVTEGTKTESVQIIKQ
jgi:hypothetical protein